MEYSHCVIFETTKPDYQPIIGLVANRLIGDYNKPFLSVLRKSDKCNLSFRMPVDSFPLADFFAVVSDKFSGGAHKGAGGGTCQDYDLDYIKGKFIEYCEKHFVPKQYLIEKSADIYLPEHSINDILKTLPKLAPFGQGFKNPEFVSDVLLENIYYKNPKFITGEFSWFDGYSKKYLEFNTFSKLKHTGYVRCKYQILFDDGTPNIVVRDVEGYG